MTMEKKNNTQMKCCICKKPIEGYGNNPFPVWPTGRCCDDCNVTIVIPARMALLAKHEEEKKEEK